MKKLITLVGCLFFKLKKCYSFFIREYIISKFSSVGSDVYIGQNGVFTYENIEIGDDVYIGANAVFQSSYGKIIIGNHVMFGPGVHIHGGNHKINEVGKLMKHTAPKQQGDDGTVIIEDDCWIGANAIILSNVTIGQGSVIGAGAVVTKSIPPYSVYTGVPQARLRNRFTDEELEIHKKFLGGAKN